MEPVLSAEGLRKSYGTTPAVVDVSLTVGPGEIVGLLGPNGAGKSTTVGMIAGVLLAFTALFAALAVARFRWDAD